MKTKQLVGIILGVSGVVISVGHLVLMMIFQTQEPYHGLATWVPFGLVLAVAGLLLIRKNEPR